MKFLWWLKARFTTYNKKDLELVQAIKMITGKKPINLALYKLAMRHSSMAKKNKNGFKESNERLEYLGDAILGAIVANYLYKKYPVKEEGFLTDIRARIVNRESLNLLAKKLGLHTLIDIEMDQKVVNAHRSIHGDTMEAFVGAFYLDRGFKKTEYFIVNKILIPHFNLDVIIKNNPNTKSILIEWGQKHAKKIKFELLEIKNTGYIKEFVVETKVDGEPVCIGHGTSKKKAEKDAAQKTLDKLEISY